MSDKTAQNVHDLLEDTVAKAGAVLDQARGALDDTIADARAVLRDLDDTEAVTAARVVAAESVANVTGAYKRHPALVIAIGSAALVAVALLTKRR